MNQGELFVLNSNLTANRATVGAGGLALNQASGSIHNSLFMLNQVPSSQATLPRTQHSLHQHYQLLLELLIPVEMHCCWEDMTGLGANDRQMCRGTKL